MYLLFFVFFFSVVVVFLLYFLVFFLSVKYDGSFKVNSFESGFLSLVKVQNSFSIHFFVIMLMFVIFDLEVVMFLGLLISDVSFVFVFVFLFLFVLFGFYLEWYYGKLVWVV